MHQSSTSGACTCASARSRPSPASTCTAYAGHATALLGRNGAGKSTTMRVLAGRGPADRRQRRASPATTSAPRPLEVKRAVGYCPDVGGLVPRATPWEHLQLSARLRRLEQLGGAGPRPARAVRARRRRAPRHHRLLARHGPAALGLPGRAARARGAAARRALRRRRPDRRRGDLRRDQRRPLPRRVRAGLHPPARARRRGVLLGAGAARRRPGRRPPPPARWPARRGHVPTAASWTEVRRAARDVGHLLAFRTSTVRRPRAFALAAAVVRRPHRRRRASCPPCSTAPASRRATPWTRSWSSPRRWPASCSWPIASAVASGGGRELLSREHGGRLPGQPHDRPPRRPPARPAQHRLAAPGVDAARAPRRTASSGRALAAAQIGMLVWIAAATAIGQVVAWTVEAVRRTTHGIAIVRRAASRWPSVAVGAPARPATSARPRRRCTTRWLVVGYVDGFTLALGRRRSRSSSALLVRRGRARRGPGAPRRPARSARRAAGRDRQLRRPAGSPRSPLAGLVRTDRGSVWRAVPMRRGLAVLADRPGRGRAGRQPGPGAQMTILPGLVASGGALLFGVNAWCLDAPRRSVAGEPAGGARRRVRRPGLGAHRVPAGRVVRDRWCWPACAPGCPAAPS